MSEHRVYTLQTTLEATLRETTVDMTIYVPDEDAVVTYSFVGRLADPAVQVRCPASHADRVLAADLKAAYAKYDRSQGR